MQLRMRQVHPHTSPRPLHKRHQIPRKQFPACIPFVAGCYAGWGVKGRGFRIIKPPVGDERVGIREEDLVVVHAVVILRDGCSGGDGVGAVF